MSSVEDRRVQLEKDRKFCSHNRTIDDFDGWSLQRLVTITAYPDDFPSETRDALKIARQRAETIGTPADRSAITSAAALEVSSRSLETALASLATAKESLENSRKQRLVTTVVGFIALLSFLVACATYQLRRSDQSTSGNSTPAAGRIQSEATPGAPSLAEDKSSPRGQHGNPFVHSDHKRPEANPFKP